jgi:hypothetical protein
MMTVKVWMKSDTKAKVVFEAYNTGVEGPFYFITEKDGDIRHLIPIADIYRIKEVEDDSVDDE